MATGSNILTEEDLNRIQHGIQQAETAEEIISLAKQAGLDVQNQEERAKNAKNQLLRIKNTFFPGR